MKKTLLASLVVLSLTACQSNDASQTSTQADTSSTNSNAALMSTALNTAISLYSQQQATQETPVVDSVQNELSVTTEQAVGGVGALLSVAQNALGTEQKQELNSLVPGASLLSSTGLVNMITSMDSVNAAFTSMGLDPALVAQFAPLVLQGLEAQGASSGLTSALTSLWQ
ncbi:DUF2780 domain-containing protein [Vibrio maerlii]|uniref:DUF2780 domain-containing protein n=1 Tax=Vibrio maerlii TaxID=2231648 RepID=UPI000E3C66B5|nr:DUF2780 domain-containing protein [Vibrio maerlii]